MKFKHLCEAKDFRLKALVTDLETKKRKVITFDIEANDLKSAIKQAKHDLTRNGYLLRRYHIAEEKWYDYLDKVSSYANDDYTYEDVWRYLDKEFKDPEDAIQYIKDKWEARVKSK